MTLWFSYYGVMIHSVVLIKSKISPYVNSNHPLIHVFFSAVSLQQPAIFCLSDQVDPFALSALSSALTTRTAVCQIVLRVRLSGGLVGLSL